MKATKRHPKSVTFEGLPVVDAIEDVHIAITKEDASKSKKKDPNNCAAALAGRRQLKTDVRVYLSRTYVKDKRHKRWIRFVTPNAISREIISFDRGAGFDPGEYKFKAPAVGQRLGYQARGGGIPTDTGTKRRARHITAHVRISAKDKLIVGKEK